MGDATLQKVTETSQELLSKLTIEASVVVTEGDGALLVTIDTSEPGALIGHHGRSLEALQIILGQMVYKALGSWVRLVVTVGDYRERREQQLKELAANAAEKVLSSREEVVLTDLTPGERRIVHLALADHPGVLSESQGEGRDRRLIVRPKS